MSFTSESQRAEWEAKVRRLGLDPDLDARGFARTITTHDLKEFISWFNVPGFNSPEKSALKGKAIAEVSNERARRMIEDHVFGRCPIPDDDTIAALQARFKTFSAEAYVAPNITITAQKPLIINSTTSITLYGDVTLEPGGYIQISVPCSFQASTFTKLQGTQSSSQYDLIVVGTDGAAAPAGTTGNSQSGQASSGSNGTCDCCGGIAESNGTDGAQGAAGGTGNTPQQFGGNGSNAPTVVMQLGALTGTLSLLNQGGAGGIGGAGGLGGNGQQGGNGGAYASCGAEYTDGGSGGNGGAGGAGSDGGPGGSGGAGGTVTVMFTPNAGATVIPTNGAAPFGAGGAAGVGGLGGAGGGGGGRGGGPGSAGDPGANGVVGMAGANAGAVGSTSINPSSANVR